MIFAGDLFPFILDQNFMQQMFAVLTVSFFTLFIVAGLARKGGTLGAGADQRPSDSGKKFFCSPAESCSVDLITRKISLTISGGASL